MPKSEKRKSRPTVPVDIHGGLTHSRKDLVYAGEAAPIKAAAADRRSIESKCDGKWYVLSKTNGQGATIKWPKNAGTCPLTIISVDNNNREINGSRLHFDAQNKTTESYSAPNGTWEIWFGCIVSTGTCVIEMDA